MRFPIATQFSLANDDCFMRRYLTGVSFSTQVYMINNLLDRDENRTLKEIMQVMQEKHQFFAT